LFSGLEATIFAARAFEPEDTPTKSPSVLANSLELSIASSFPIFITSS
jgi:hypothetical protein